MDGGVKCRFLVRIVSLLITGNLLYSVLFVIWFDLQLVFDDMRY